MKEARQNLEKYEVQKALKVKEREDHVLDSNYKMQDKLDELRRALKSFY